jgi:hypothetical protein
MANKKISQLTAASALTGTEPLPIVQGGVTVKSTVNDVASVVGSPIFQPDVIYYAGTTAGGIAISMTDYAPTVLWSRQILAPNLVTIYGSIYMNGNGGYGDPILNTISMPLLNSVGSLTVSSDYGVLIEYFPFLETINLGSLTTINSNNSPLYISNCPVLTTLNIENLQTVNVVNYIEISNNDVLTSINIDNLTTFDGNFYGQNNAFNQVTVDGILNQLANVVVLTNRDVDLSGGTNAAPSVTGATYVATLVANGCTVTTN